MNTTILSRFPVWAALMLVTVAAAAYGESHLMRFADVDKDKIVFTYEGDLWLVWSSGGDAIRLTRSAGEERFAKLSPDGSLLAFTANYDGGSDVYVMNTTGGEPRRLTFHPASDDVLDWFPDGKSILFRSRREYPFRVDKLFKVAVEGGPEEKLPVDQAGLSTLSPDGKRIAYCRISREFATWKRHQGGTAQDLWMGSLADRDYKKITDWAGTDSYPMWWGDGVYFLSDRKFGTLNLYRYDVPKGQVKALTSYTDYDVKYPSIGGNQIVFQYGESLHVLELGKEQVRAVPINIKSDGTLTREKFVSAADHTGAFGLSPSGQLLAIESRGEILTVPAKEGRALNLTQTSGSREKNCAWSPDGKWVLFISDRGGEENFYLAAADGSSRDWKPVTTGGKGFMMQPVWSPDGKHFAHADKFMKLSIVNVESGEATTVDQGEYDDGWERWGIQDYTWSPDSRWLAYTKMEGSGNESVFLYSLDTKQATRATSPMTEDFSPSFSRDGKYLYFLSHRTFSPIMDRIDQNHVFLDVCRPYLIVLKEGEPSPFAPKDVVEPVKASEPAATPAPAAETPATTPPAAATTAPAATPPAGPASSIDLAGLERRVVAAPGVEAGNYFRLEATSDGFVYLSRPDLTFTKYQNVNDKTSDRMDLYGYALGEKKASKLMSGVENYHLSADGKKLVYRSGTTFGAVDAGRPASIGDGAFDLGAVKLKVDLAEEFEQIFHEAWRVQRDWFYDANLHGEDWPAVGARYAKFLPFCGDRSDLNYLIGEMIGELNAGHTYIQGGEMPDRGPRVGSGLLGVDFESPPSAAFPRIAHIIPSTPGDPAETSPLDQPGCPIKEGHYLIAIDGREIKATDNVFAFLHNKSGAVVELTFNDRPTAEGARKHLVKTIGSEQAIRYREWVNVNARKVEQLSGGRIGYLHIPDMGESGLIEFAKAFYPQHDREALVIDERYNGGGFVGDMIIDRLERKLWALTQPREGKVARNPERCFHGHLAVLINDSTGSNGEYFAEAIKRVGLATVIGTRTWGGSIGIEPHQDFLDGGQTTPPQFAPYGLDGQWLIEGHGVDPDIVIDNAPAEVLAGKDAQLERAVAHLLEQVGKSPKPIPPTPAYPIKTKPKQ